MITKKCDKCGKIIEGYTQNQVDYMLDQHNLMHKYNKLKITEKINHPKEDEVYIQDEKKEITLAEHRKRFLEE